MLKLSHSLFLTVAALVFATTFVYAGSFAIFQTASSSGGGSVVSNTGVWLDGGPGAGDLTTEIKIYPDCTSATPFNCTKLLRTDSNNAWMWSSCITPTCLINGPNDAGHGWNPIPLPAALTDAQNANIANIGGSGYYGQYQAGVQGLAACAWTTDQAQTLTGTTSDIYLIMNGAVSATVSSVFVTTNKGASWTNTGESIAAPNGVNNEAARQNSPIVWCDPNSSGQIAYVGQYNAALVETTNGGSTWSSVGGLPTPSGDATEIIGDPTSAVTSGTTQGLYAWVQGSGLYASTNGGTSWTAVTSSGMPSGNAYYPMKVDKFGQVWIFASGQSAPIFKYSGGGAAGTWTNISGLCSGAYASPTFDSTSTSAGAERIYAWCGGTYYSSTGGGTSSASWSELEALTSATVNSGGSGCTSGVQTFTVSGGTALAAATFKGTVSGGSLSGALSVVIPGSYTSIPSGDPTVTGGGCSGAPSIVPSWATSAINKSTATNVPGGGDVPWLSDGPSVPGFSDIHDTSLDLAGNFYMSSGYGVYYAASNSDPVFAVQSVGFEASTIQGSVNFAAKGLGFTVTSWDTGMFTNVAPALYAWNNFASNSPSFETQPPTVAPKNPWIACQAEQTPWDGCSTDGGHTFTQWSSYPGDGVIATLDGQDILVLTGGVLECSTNGGSSWAAVSGPPADTPGVFEKSSGVYEYVLSAYNINGTWTSAGGCAGTWTEVNSAQATGASFGIPGQIGIIIQSAFPGVEPGFSTNSGTSFTPLTPEMIGGVGVGAAKPGSSTPYTIYVNGINGSTYGTWYSTNGGSTWTAVSSVGLNGYFGYTETPMYISADPDIYGVIEGTVDGTNYSVLGLSDSCPAVYWNPKITYPTMNVTGSVTLTAQDAGLAAPSSIVFTVDGTTIASFTPSVTAASYNYVWNSGSVATGAHTLAVVSNGNGCIGVSKSIPITTH
jgi:hypothetical protein